MPPTVCLNMKATSEIKTSKLKWQCALGILVKNIFVSLANSTLNNKLHYKSVNSLPKLKQKTQFQQTKRYYLQILTNVQLLL